MSVIGKDVPLVHLAEKTVCLWIHFDGLVSVMTHLLSLKKKIVHPKKNLVEPCSCTAQTHNNQIIPILKSI